MEIRNPKEMLCAICRKTGAWILLYQDIVCSACLRDFNERINAENKDIVKQMKTDNVRGA